MEQHTNEHRNASSGSGRNPDTGESYDQNDISPPSFTSTFGEPWDALIAIAVFIGMIFIFFALVA